MKATTINNVSFYRTNNDVNGNPRYIVHFLDFMTDGEAYRMDIESGYKLAKSRANGIGFRVYRGKDFGGGFVGQSYSLYDTAKHINEAKGGK